MYFKLLLYADVLADVSLQLLDHLLILVYYPGRTSTDLATWAH